MRRSTLVAVVVLPQVAAFYAVRGTWRWLNKVVGERIENEIDGFELAVLEELASWDRALNGPAIDKDDSLFPRVLP